jgi:hypothetical protein
MSELSELGERALRLVGRGYRVFPLVPNDKRPITTNGFKDATDDRDQVAKWWSDTPGANIGIRTGDGLVVVDVDRLPKDGVKKVLPNPWIEPLAERLETLAADSVVESPTGGFHLYFAADRALEELGEIRNSTAEMADGVDVRAEGGYIVAPGSVIDGRHYRELDGRTLVDRRDLPDLPPALIADFRRMKSSKSRGKVREKKPGGEPRQSLGMIEEGKRHAALVSEAGRLRGLGLGEEGILAELRRFNAARCNPPQDDADLVRLARDYAEKDAREEWALVTRKASEIEVKPIEWLIGNRLPRGMISTFVGLPGAGKSMLAAFIASKISTGNGMTCDPESWPPRPPGRVLIFAFEDGGEMVLRPRLEAMGADLERIEVCEVKARGEEEQGIDLLKDFPLIERKVIESSPDLIVIDPVNSAWGAGKDQNNDVEARQVLAPFKRLAEAHRASVLLVTHTNKRSDVSDAQDTASGARAIVGISRTVYLVGRLKEEDGSFAHYLADMKVNIRESLGALKFTVTGEDAGSAKARVTVIGVEDMDANEFMQEKSRRAREERQAKGESKLEEAKRTAHQILQLNGGAMLSARLEIVLVEEKGLAKKTVQEAMKVLADEGVFLRRKERKRNGRNWVFFKDNEPSELREDREDRHHP